MTKDSPRGKPRMSHTMQDCLQVVSFTLGAEEYAIEITRVEEIILVEGITRVPQSPAYIEGIINLRGLVIPVVDLRKRLGVGAGSRDERTRVVVARLGGTIVGMIVDAVSQVMRIAKADIQPPPGTIACLAGEYLVGVASRDGRMLLLLDLERVLGVDEAAGLLPATSAP
jgi:purine-binding chemotaxis protein CheW